MDSRLTNRVTVQLTDEQRQDLEGAAEAERRPLSFVSRVAIARQL